MLVMKQKDNSSVEFFRNNFIYAVKLYVWEINYMCTGKQKLFMFMQVSELINQKNSCIC